MKNDPTPTPLDLEAAEKAVEIASEELGRLCKARWAGGEAWEKAWHWEIPANEEREEKIRYRIALRSIAANSCCGDCQEAKRVAVATLAGEVEDGPRPGGGEAKTPRGDAASGWDSNQAAQALQERVKALEDGLADALEGMEDMVGYVQEYFRKKWSHDDYIQRARMLLGLEPAPEPRPAPGASLVPPVTPGIPGEGERA